MQIRFVVTFIFILSITFLGSGIDAIIAQVHLDARKYTFNARRTGTTVEQLEAQSMSSLLIATMCLSIDQCITLSFVNIYTENL